MADTRRHDCDVAKALGYTWTQNLKASGNETPGDFFASLVAEYREEMQEALGENSHGEGAVPQMELPMRWLAEYVSRICAPFSFHVNGDTPELIRSALAELIAREMQSVQGYVSTWRSNGAMNALKSKDVEAETRAHVGAHAFAWPQILEQPSRERSDGRFVKAFPLIFPMGVADLYQPRLRSDFHVVEAVQHLFRYHTGHMLRSNDGHRVTWALFNTALREIGYDKGGLVHKNVNERILTKQELQAMYETRRDLVSRVSSFGAEIPTTSMQWKREAHELEWIVRQMSWAPPWTPAESLTEMESKSRACLPRKEDAASSTADVLPGDGNPAPDISTKKKPGSHGDESDHQ